jgi:hypothetical protein
VLLSVGSQPALHTLPPHTRGPLLLLLLLAGLSPQQRLRLPPPSLLLLLLPQPSLATSLQSMTSYSSYDLQQATEYKATAWVNAVKIFSHQPCLQQAPPLL